MRSLVELSSIAGRNAQNIGYAYDRSPKSHIHVVVLIVYIIAILMPDSKQSLDMSLPKALQVLECL